MRARLGGIALLLAAAALAACTEKPQTAVVKKSDVPPYQGAENPYVAAGWNAGDSGSWEEQIRVRTRNQNEYVRIK